MRCLVKIFLFILGFFVLCSPVVAQTLTNEIFALESATSLETNASLESIISPEVVSTSETYISTQEISSTTEVKSLTPEATTTKETGLRIKGSKTLNFVSRSIEGTKEGFVPGLSREESLRVNIAGKIDKETDVDANFISTSNSGTTTTSQNDEKVSILVRRASTEVYYGDFIADFDDTEFARLNKSLSGIKISGNYDKWGFKALYSTPRGQPKYYKSYGDNTQGPYYLGSAPVVVDSDRVYLNGAEQKRGEDYIIDYQAGTVTFKKGIVLNVTIIEVYYDWRETLYQHSTVGLRYKQDLNESLKFGVTYLDDSDSLYKASAIRESLSSTIEPVSHYLVGVDGSAKIGNTKLDSEFAYSNRDLNILEPGAQREIGKALKLNTYTDQGPISLSTNFKRVGPHFMSISDASPKQDVDEYGGTLGFRPSSIYYAETNYGYDKYKLLGTKYLTIDKGLKSKFTPETIPSFNYFYHETEDSNDPVSAAKITRLTTKNNAESSYRYGFLNSTIAGGVEERVNRYPSKEATTYKTVNFGTATYGLEKISASTNIELKDTILPDKKTQYAKTYNANVSVTPSPNYFGALALQLIDDSENGISDVADLNYRAAPTNSFLTDGKYNITYIKEDFNGSKEAVTKQAGSFKFDYRPADVMRYRYYFKPSFTRVEDTNSFSYSDYTNQGEVLYTPIKELSTGVIYKTGDTMNVDRTDLAYKREANHRYSYDSTFLVNSAPLRFLSLQFTFLNSDIFLTEQTTAGVSSYFKTNGNDKKYDFDARTSLSEQFSLDSRYTYENQKQRSDKASSNIDTLTNTIFLKGSWNYNENWIFFASYSYSESLNNLLTSDNITYTVAPGFGLTYKIGEMLRVDGEYSRSKSYAASSAEIDNYSIKTKYDPNEYVHINLRAMKEISVEPNYKASEIMGSLEIVL